MITKEEFLILYEKNLSGKCTPEEKQLLEAYHDEIAMPDDKWDKSMGSKQQLYNILNAKLHESMGSANNNRRFTKQYNWLKWAAGLLIFFSVSLFFWKQKQHTTPYSALTKVQPVVIRPGGNKAYLTTSNGVIITLNGIKNGKLLAQSGTQINKLKDGLLEYSGQQPGNEQSSADENAYNILNVPRGGEYQLVLADGTKVWLNSASSLKYPVSFNGKERVVELSGEAYFEVVKNDAKPFKVLVNGVTVQDLGTHFNIMGYTDEKEVKTTLLEGAVKLINQGHEAFLKPGEQGMLNAQQTGFNIKDVDVDDVVAWKNGLFAFNDEDIQTIMRRISRWYDVDVVFPAQFKRKNFGGTISRFKDVNDVLNALQLTGSIHFKIEGRRITVMP